jgi:hypothetical protein
MPNFYMNFKRNVHTFVIEPEPPDVGEDVIGAGEVDSNLGTLRLEHDIALLSRAQWLALASLLLLVFQDRLFEPDAIDTLVRDVIVVVSEVDVNYVNGDRLTRRGDNAHSAVGGRWIAAWVAGGHKETALGAKHSSTAAHIVHQLGCCSHNMSYHYMRVPEQDILGAQHHNANDC